MELATPLLWRKRYASRRRRFIQRFLNARSGKAGPVFRIYHVRELIARNWATVGAWEFKPPSTVMIWPLTYALSSEPK